MSQSILYLLQALNAAQTIVASAPTVIAATQAVANLVNETNAALAKMRAENRDPSADEWAAQAKIISDLRAQLHAA